GQANIAGAEKLLSDIAEAGEGLEDFEILVDTREISGSLTASELWSLSERLVRYRTTFSHRTAVVCTSDRFDHARFFSLCAENKWFNIRAFTSYEDAMEWLITE